MDRLHQITADEVRKEKMTLSMRNEEERSREINANLHDYVPVGRVKKILVEYDPEKDIFYRYYRINKLGEYRFKMFGIHKFTSEDKGTFFIHRDDWKTFKMNLYRGRCQSMYIRMREIRGQEYGWYRVIFEFIYFHERLKKVRGHLSYIGSWNAAGGDYDKSNVENLEADFFCENSSLEKEYLGNYASYNRRDLEQERELCPEIDAGDKVCSSRYKMSSLLLDTYYFMRHNCKNAQVKFLMKVENSLPEILMGDENKIFQILTNLLSNAIKSTSQGFIVLKVGGCKKATASFLLEIEVKITGFGFMGAEPSVLELPVEKRMAFKTDTKHGRGNIFRATLMQKIVNNDPLIEHVRIKKRLLVLEPEIFVKEYISWTLSQISADYHIYDGTESIILDEEYSCLLVRDCVFLQNKKMLEKYFIRSQIILLTEQEKGIDVSLMKYRQIPLSRIGLDISRAVNCVKEQENNTPCFQNIVEFKGLWRRKLLAADSCGLDLKITQAILKSYFFEVDSADNEAEVLDLLNHNIYSLVLIDQKILDGNGIKKFIALKEEYDYENIPFILILKTVDVFVRKKMLQDRIDDYLMKPLEISELNRILDKYLKLETAKWPQQMKKEKRRDYPETGLLGKLKIACLSMEYDKAENIIIKMLHHMYPADVTAHLYAMLESCREFEYDELERQVIKLVEGYKEQ